MPIFVLAFLAGILLLQQCPVLPQPFWVAIVLLIGILLKIQVRGHRLIFRILLGGWLGFAWCLLYAVLQMSWTLPEQWEGKDVSITGYIAEVPIKSEQGMLFLFDMDTLNQQPAQARIRLSWKNNVMPIKAGDRWALTVQLKRIHGLCNPGSVDHEALALYEGVRATGHVIGHGSMNLRSTNYYYGIHRFRQYLHDLMQSSIKITATSHWIITLATGVREGIHQEDWQVLRKTGTNHLMVIAGLHIGFMSGFVFFLTQWCWRRSARLSLRIPAQQAAAVAALCMALIYTALAGFSIPTQRASIMITALLLMRLLRRCVLPWGVWALAVFSVLVINPLGVLTDSFWLSLGSVALIIYGMSGRLLPQGVWWEHGRIQWVMALGLLPLGIALFQECSFTSFLANSIAVPIVGWIIVPFTLLGTFLLLLSPKFAFILNFADWILHYLWVFLSDLSRLPWSSYHLGVSKIWMVISGCFGVVLFLMPRGLPGRWLGGVFILPMVLQKPLLTQGEVFFTLLDVGQGLSAVVQTQHHTLVYDTGMKWGDSLNRGETVLLPFLRTQGVHKIDKLVISHADSDHSGGAGVVLEQMPVFELTTSVPDFFAYPASLCLQGTYWEWDHVQFRFLYPDRMSLGLGNDSSCVLYITVGNQHIMLTGDIEKGAEKKLLTTYRDLGAEIVVAPHHGSKTSGMLEFIRALHPKIALFPVGYRNAYHLPHPMVVASYRDQGAILYDSIHHGAIQFYLNGEVLQPPSLYRLENQRYWHGEDNP